MKKKFLNFIFAICFFLPCAILFGGCSEEPLKSEVFTPEEPKTSINITFASKYGNLEFSSKELELTNGFAYIQNADLPQITNEGNDKIFDYWATADGEKFNFDLKVYDDVELQAVFCYELEFVWEWDRYDSLALYKQKYDSSIYVSENNGVTNISSSYGTPSYDQTIKTFKKIKKSDCLDKYITREEYYELPAYACFITSVDKDTIVTTEDLTTDTYACYQYIFITDSYCGLAEGITYLPKGVSASVYADSFGFIAKNYAKQVLTEKYGLNYDQFTYDYSLNKPGVYFTVDEFRDLNQQTLSEFFDNSTTNTEDIDWQEDSYYAVCKYDWIKFSCTLEDGSVKYFVLAENRNTVGGYKLFENISKAEYDSYA